MVQPIRRVYTGHDNDGRSVFISDANATAVKEMESMPGLAITDLWVTNGPSASNAGSDDATADRSIVLEPPAGGSIFRVVEFPPDTAWKNSANADEWSKAIGADHVNDQTVDDPMMHKTATVDYLIVLKGEIWAIMEEGEVCLKQGDCMIQRGTNHSWSVRTIEPCLLAAILVDAEPV